MQLGMSGRENIMKRPNPEGTPGNGLSCLLVASSYDCPAGTHHHSYLCAFRIFPVFLFVCFSLVFFSSVLFFSSLSSSSDFSFVYLLFCSCFSFFSVLFLSFLLLRFLFVCLLFRSCFFLLFSFHLFPLPSFFSFFLTFLFTLWFRSLCCCCCVSFLVSSSIPSPRPVLYLSIFLFFLFFYLFCLFLPNTDHPSGSTEWMAFIKTLYRRVKGQLDSR